MDTTWLTAAVDLLRAPLGGFLPVLSTALREAVPHRALAELTVACAHSPLKTAGDPELTARVTGAELERLAATVAAESDGAWYGTARIAGTDRTVLAVSSDAAPRGALLVLIRQDGAPAPGPREAGVVRALWDILSAHQERLSAEAVPGPLAQSRATAAERSRAIAELGDAHAAALTGLLAVLRGRSLSDADARARATDLAVSALLDLRAGVHRDRELSEETANEAFAQLRAGLEPLVQHSSVRMEFAPPGTVRPLPGDVAKVARATVRAVVLAVLDQDPVHRVHVGWEVGEDELRATVRDDGPGELTRCALSVHRIEERLAALGGRSAVDGLAGWGTTVTLTVPLTTPEVLDTDPLNALGARELEVLGHLARGHRNRAIAQALHISESTVKFHVANILDKLAVASRGEAAALAHTLGVAA